MRLLCLNFQVKVSLKANKRHGTAELQVGLLSRAQLWNKKSAPKIASKRSLLRRHPPKRLVDYQGKTGQKTPQRMWLVANDLTFMDSLSNYRRLISRKMRISCVHYHKQISSLHTWGYLDSLQVEHLVTLFRKLASDTVFLCFFFCPGTGFPSLNTLHTDLPNFVCFDPPTSRFFHGRQLPGSRLPIGVSFSESKVSQPNDAGSSHPIVLFKLEACRSMM